MKHLKYNDYVGSVEFDVEDNILFGKLLHIRDLISYEGKDIQSLQASFEVAVDEYLEDCAADGLTADRPFKGSFNVRLTPDLHRELAIAAKSFGCTLNEYVAETLTLHKREEAIHRPNVRALQQWMELAIRGAHSSFKNSNLPSSSPWNVKDPVAKKDTTYWQQSFDTDFNKVVPIRAGKGLH